MRTRWLAALLTFLLVACSDDTGNAPREAGGPNPDGMKPDTAPPAPKNLNPAKPASLTKLVFIHHSVGEDWGRPDGGDLRAKLNENNYHVADTNYDWGPADADAGEAKIGDHTDIGHWSSWFLGPNRDTYLGALFVNTHVTDSWGTNTTTDPGGENTVVMFKSCFLSGMRLSGNASDPLPGEGSANPIKGQPYSEEAAYTIANAKGLYRDLLGYFASRQDRLFVLVTTPPSVQGEVSAVEAQNLRALNQWLVRKWLASYPHKNVAVLDLHNVLTSNGGSTDQNDLGASGGAHHRLAAGGKHVEALLGPSDFLQYATSSSDSHPTAAGLKKATGELLPLLNVAYHCWKGSGDCPTLMGRE
jgi:hypothetical protein